MKKHSGMRPQDVAVLLKILSQNNARWYIKDLAAELFISQSEVSESLHRSFIAGLISADKKSVMKQSLLEFLEHGLKFVFPQKPGALVAGIATSHSAPPLKNFIASKENYVWPYAEGNMRGQSIEPLYSAAPKASLKDKKLYELLALTDALRVGRAREKSLALKEIKKRIG
jgi:hypothetical protein